MTKPSKAVVVLVTCPTRAVARRLARKLVDRGLAACVNILPGLTSVYTWNGKTEQAKEVLLLIKTPRAGFERLRRGVLSWHPYEVPEVIALPIVQGHPAYLRWVAASVRAA
jgi:periplasmic divalent cation tolerance protein